MRKSIGLRHEDFIPNRPRLVLNSSQRLDELPLRARSVAVCHSETLQRFALSLTPCCFRCEYFAVLIVVVLKVRWRGGVPVRLDGRDARRSRKSSPDVVVI